MKKIILLLLLSIAPCFADSARIMIIERINDKAGAFNRYKVTTYLRDADQGIPVVKEYSTPQEIAKMDLIMDKQNTGTARNPVRIVIYFNPDDSLQLVDAHEDGLFKSTPRKEVIAKYATDLDEVKKDVDPAKPKT